MERFFLEHSVQRDRDADELGGRRLGNSDSEASDAEEEVTERVRSVADPTGPWRQTPVGRDSAWGQPQRAARPGERRAFRSAHTGPKGVISDYKAHKRHQRQERARKDGERQQALLRIAKGASTLEPHEAAELQQLQQVGDGDGSSEDDSDEEDPTDAAFMEQYRLQRLAQLRSAAPPPPTKIVYGALEYLSPERFVELVGLAPPASMMLVHLFDPESYACELLNRQLELLAAKLVHVKFAAMAAREADASIAASDLPVVMIYQGTTLLETVVHVSQALGAEFTPASVEAFVRGRLGL